MRSKTLFLSSAVLLVLVVFLFVGSVGASEMWSQTYGGIEDEEAYSLIETSDGGYAVTGDGKLFVKTDEHGNVEWTRAYAGKSLVATSDGGYAIAGTKHNNFWLAKTDEYGVIPEFLSWTPVLVMVVALVAMIVVYRYNLKKLRGWATA